MKVCVPVGQPANMVLQTHVYVANINAHAEYTIQIPVQHEKGCNHLPETGRIAGRGSARERKIDGEI
jgi:hypothetical protein